MILVAILESRRTTTEKGKSGDEVDIVAGVSVQFKTLQETISTVKPTSFGSVSDSHSPDSDPSTPTSKS